jgi:hypothetical protein
MEDKNLHASWGTVLPASDNAVNEMTPENERSLMLLAHDRKSVNLREMFVQLERV